MTAIIDFYNDYRNCGRLQANVCDTTCSCLEPGPTDCLAKTRVNYFTFQRSTVDNIGKVSQATGDRHIFTKRRSTFFVNSSTTTLKKSRGFEKFEISFLSTTPIYEFHLDQFVAPGKTPVEPARKKEGLKQLYSDNTNKNKREM